MKGKKRASLENRILPKHLEINAERTALNEAKPEIAYALFRSYELGSERPINLAKAWAWLRWAHDGCAQAPSSESDGIELRHAVNDDYLRLVKTLTAEEKRTGDFHLCACMEECGVASGIGAVHILSVGGAGGSIDLHAVWGAQGWKFFRKVDDWTPELLGEESISHTSPIRTTWRGALKLVSAYPWHRLVCIEAHPEFHEKIWAAYNRRWRNTSIGRQRHREEWKEACGRNKGGTDA